MDYEQMEIDITLESDRDLKENMQATAKFALGQIMEYQHPTKVKNRHEGYGIAAEGYASLQGKMKSTKTDMDDLLKLLPNGEYMDEQEAGASEDDGFEEADNNKEDVEEMEE